MDIEYILNDCLNKAMCQKGRIQHPNSNNIADFVIKYLEAINDTRCCTPKGTVKTINFERTIDLLDAEIDSLKDAYHQETITDRKTVYSSMILESLHAKKKLKE